MRSGPLVRGLVVRRAFRPLEHLLLHHGAIFDAEVPPNSLEHVGDGALHVSKQSNASRGLCAYVGGGGEWLEQAIEQAGRPARRRTCESSSVSKRLDSSTMCPLLTLGPLLPPKFSCEGAPGAAA